jgi:toxin ParE1/3/4
MPQVIRTGQAERDLEEILAYLDARSHSAAERLATAIDERSRLLGEFPGMGRSRDELLPGVRSIAIGRYVLFYRVTQNAVEVLRILHGARDLEAIMKAEGPQ